MPVLFFSYITSRLKKHVSRCITMAFAITLLLPICYAQQLRIEKVSEPRAFKNDKDQIDDTIEASAVAPIGDGRYLLVADDKDDGMGRSLLIVDRSTGAILRRLDNFQGGSRNPKWEGLAKLGAEYFVIGSHGADAGEPTEKLMARSRVFRFILQNETASDPANINIDRASVREYDIVPALVKEKVFDRNNPENVKIEGLAARNKNGKRELVIGLRAPYQTIKSGDRSMSFALVYSADLPDPAKIQVKTRLDLRPLMIFDAGQTTGPDQPFPLHLSSIDYFSELNGFVIVTSSERSSDNAFFGNVVSFVSDREIADAMPNGFKDRYRAARPVKLLEFQPKMKAEGICILPSEKANFFRLMIVYDNDAWSFKNRLPNASMVQEIEIEIAK